MVAIRSGNAADMTVQQAVFSPNPVVVGGNFTFSFNVTAAITVSNANVAMDLMNSSGVMVLQKTAAGQSLKAGKTTAFSWSSAMVPATSKSSPFPAGFYHVVVKIFSSNYGIEYGSPVTAATFTLTAPKISSNATASYTPPPTNVGSTATAPIPPPAGTGHTYYVSDPSNSAVDRANRALLPAGATVYSTLQAAANVTQPGDTVLAMNGTYKPNPSQWVVGVLNVTTSGSAAGGYITYAAYPGHHPIITISNSTNTWDTVALSASYIVVRGFEIIGSAQTINLAYANKAAAVEEAVLQKEAAAGQQASYPSSTAKDVMNGNCIGGSKITHTIILNNIIHDCSAAGIDLEQCDYTTIEANTVYNTSWWTMYDTSGIDLHLALNSDSSTAYKNYVLDNISYNSGNTQPFDANVYDNYKSPGSAPAASTDGNGIIIDSNTLTNDGSAYLGRTLVAGNIAYGNGGSGIHAYYSNHVDIVNNTAYMNDTCPVAGSNCGPAATTINGASVSGQTHGQLYSMYGSDNHIYNNILYAPAGKYISTNWGNTNVVENNNILYSANGLLLLANYQPAAQDIAANPQFSKSTSPASNLFLFAAGSPGINAGISYSNDNVSVPSLIGLKVTGGMVNIGAGQ